MRQYLLNIILLFLGFTIIYSCSRHQQINRTIFLADSIMEYQPDSAFKLLIKQIYLFQKTQNTHYY